MHCVTDGQTDGETADITVPIADHDTVYDRLKRKSNKQCANWIECV